MEECSCNSAKRVTDYKTGETICKGCGLVLERTMIEEQLHTDGGGKTIVHVSPSIISYHDKDLGSEMRGNKDIKGKRISNKERRRMNRLKRFHTNAKVLSQYEKMLKIGLIQMAKIKGIFHFPMGILSDSSHLFRKYMKDVGLRRGQSVEKLAGSIVYVVARKMKLPVSMKDYERFTGIRPKHLRKVVKELKQKFNYDSPRLTPMDFIYKYASLMNLDRGIVNEAEKILKGYKKTNIQPSAVAGSVLYYCAKKKNKAIMNYIRLERTTKISPPRIRIIVKELRKIYGE